MYKFRKKLSYLLVLLARKVYPSNPKIDNFWAQMLMDEMLMGTSVISIKRVDPIDVHLDPTEAMDGKTTKRTI